jgi:hypothetical protein
MNLYPKVEDSSYLRVKGEMESGGDDFNLSRADCLGRMDPKIKELVLKGLILILSRKFLSLEEDC